MARQLWLLRHGEAVPHGSKEDSERELTPRGETQAATAGRAMARLNIEFDACYASPKVRARDTARIACEALGVETETADEVAEDFDVADALALFDRTDADDAKILVVGHEPDFSQVVHDLTGARMDFKKGGIAAIRLEGSRGELCVVLRPRDLEAIAG